MILLDVVVVTISNLPLGCFIIYAVTNASNRLFTPTETLLIYLVQLLTAAQSSGSFYLYLVVSPAFRTNIKLMLAKLLCGWTPAARNAVVPVSATAPAPRTTMVQIDT